MKLGSALVIACLLAGVAASAGAASKVGDRLGTLLDRSQDDARVLAWVFFTDKGSHEYLKSSVPLNVVSERSIRRRLKVRAENEVVDYTDLPVDEQYVTDLSARVMRVRQRTKWFNGVSVLATKRQLLDVEERQPMMSKHAVHRQK